MGTFFLWHVMQIAKYIFYLPCLLNLTLLWRAEHTKGWYLCQLEVSECKKVPWPNAVIVKKYSVEDCGWSSKEFAYECKISLLTGRTHQVSTFFLYFVCILFSFILAIMRCTFLDFYICTCCNIMLPVLVFRLVMTSNFLVYFYSGRYSAKNIWSCYSK